MRHNSASIVFLMEKAEGLMNSEQQPAPVQEIHGKRESLSEWQRHIMAALAAGYRVFLHTGPLVDKRDAVFIETGSRLPRSTIETLLGRELIEEAEREKEPGQQKWHEIIFFKLTERGLNEARRMTPRALQTLSEVYLPLPERVEEIRAIAERYQAERGIVPRVEVRGERIVLLRKPDEPRQWPIPYIKNWQAVAAYDDEEHMLGLLKPPDERPEDLLWVVVEPWFLGGEGRLRLRPETKKQ
jgi:hypothetical protein